MLDSSYFQRFIFKHAKNLLGVFLKLACRAIKRSTFLMGVILKITMSPSKGRSTSRSFYPCSFLVYSFHRLQGVVFKFALRKVMSDPTKSIKAYSLYNFASSRQACNSIFLQFLPSEDLGLSPTESSISSDIINLIITNPTLQIQIKAITAIR